MPQQALDDHPPLRLVQPLRGMDGARGNPVPDRDEGELNWALRAR